MRVTPAKMQHPLLSSSSTIQLSSGQQAIALASGEHRFEQEELFARQGEQGERLVEERTSRDTSSEDLI